MTDRPRPDGSDAVPVPARRWASLESSPRLIDRPWSRISPDATCSGPRPGRGRRERRGPPRGVQPGRHRGTIGRQRGRPPAAVHCEHRRARVPPAERRQDHDRLRHAPDRQLAGFASGDEFIVDRIRAIGRLHQGLHDRRQDLRRRDRRQGQQSDPEPRVAGRPGADPPGQGRPHRHDLDARDDQPGRPDLRSAGRPCLSTVVPWQAWFFGAAGRPDQARAVQVHDDVLLRRGDLRRLLHPDVGPDPDQQGRRPACSPTTPTATPSGAPGRTPIAKAGYTFVDGGAYPDGTTDFTAMISTFKRPKARDLHQCAAAARLQHVLEAGRPAGLQAEARDRRQGPPLPGRHRGARRPGEQHRHRLLVGSVHALQVVADRRDQPGLADAYQAASGKQWLQTLGSTYSLFEVAQLAFTAVSDPHDKDAWPPRSAR